MGNINTHLQRRSRLFLALLIVYLGRKALGRFILSFLLRWRSGETPRLVHRATDGNKKLLSHCPSITKSKYYPPWRLFNGHLQTVRFAYDERGPEINYKRQLLKLPDGGVASLDWALLHDQNVPNTATDLNASASSSWLPDVESTRRTVIVLPGLTGGSPENYIRTTIAKLHKLGWQCVVLNARGCANTPVTTAQLFCSAYTGDLRYVLQQLSEKYHFAQEAFVAAGFSMGANVLVKYLGEDGDQTPLTGAVSVGNPFDLTICSANFGGSLLNRLTYDKALNSNLRELFFVQCDAAKQFENYPGVDLEAIKATRTVRDFDDTLTKHVFHYDTVDDYYSDAGSVKKLGGVRVPLLCINAEDDPISISAALPKDHEVEANPNIILCTTKSGGHLAFYESSLKQQNKEDCKNVANMWTVNPIAEFAEAVRLNKVEAVA
ncbi:serine protease family S33, putative [Phytophthora infestans T30-4]|uniref:Serine protease family S33, putative n=2 Tax=Phytophthora infestans TaxID=4787 RepID=D0NRK9_PHYIT|nr:serine protease family S33, putative [Phytophthora infestans T30-4]EEY63359.1 serine protease family S33, putative [Phytophthora infestans T30-4]KAF4044948.1 alpha/beta hydrolase fold [Phytophthora infestans]KAF4138918.1 alpha/beta hydrolase fold [Phytophthora infestans]KAI9982435.1 hypothetical protein PInf_008378 [Phytophthora infestans]|eukprot:XP_002898244.1 serine protease family S33, putative [Phytophthora infestans T30-4]